MRLSFSFGHADDILRPASLMVDGAETVITVASQRRGLVGHVGGRQRRVHACGSGSGGATGRHSHGRGSRLS